MDKELAKARKKGLELDLTNEQWDKLQGNCEPGCRISIYWKQDDVSKEHEWDPIIDKGYIFVGIYIRNGRKILKIKKPVRKDEPVISGDNH